MLKTVENIFERSGFIITGRDYSDRIIVEAAVRGGDEDKFRDTVAGITSGNTRAEEIKRIYMDFPVKYK
jgi:hypothetical protein